MRARRTLATGAGLAAAISILFASPALAVAASWTPVVDLSAGGSDATQEQLVVDSNGLATAVWVRGINIESSTSLNGGTWTTPVIVSAGQMADTPHIAVDPSGLVTAIWVNIYGPNNIIESSTSLNGQTWSTPVALSAFPGGSVTPQVTVDKTGLATAVWNNMWTGDIESSTSLKGGTWSDAVNVSGLGQQPDHPQVAVDSNGLVTAAWNFQDRSCDYGGVQAASSATRGSWSVPTKLSTGCQDSSFAQLAVTPNGLATVVWSADVRDDSNIQSRSSMNGGAWSSVAGHPAVGDGGGLLHITAAPGGSVFVTWIDGSSTVQANSSTDGVTWSTPASLIPGDTAFHTSATAITVDSSGRATAVWEEGTVAGDYVIASSTSVNGIDWSTSVTLSDPSTQSLYSSYPFPAIPVVVDDNGLVTAVWQRYDGTNTIVQSSTITYPIESETPPAADDATLAMTGTNGSISALLAGAAGLLGLMGIALVMRPRRRTPGTQ